MLTSKVFCKINKANINCSLHTFDFLSVIWSYLPTRKTTTGYRYLVFLCFRRYKDSVKLGEVNIWKVPKLLKCIFFYSKHLPSYLPFRQVWLMGKKDVLDFFFLFFFLLVITVHYLPVGAYIKWVLFIHIRIFFVLV